MATTCAKDVKLRRPASVGLVSLVAALLISACGSDSESPPSSGAAPQNSTQNSALDAAQEAEWLETAEQVAAPGGDAALAVEALRATPAAGLVSARRTRQVVMFGDSLSDVATDLRDHAHLVGANLGRDAR